jgi:predicted RNase H-like HicB family nuclease
MKVEITLYPSEEGFAVCVPSLPGCWSQGSTREEAVENISDAIREYLEASDEPPNGTKSPIPSGPGGQPAFSAEAELRELDITD